MSYNQNDVEAKQAASGVYAANPEPVVVQGQAMQNVAQPTGAIEPSVRIPDHFIKVACMACTFANCDFPACFGWKAAGTCLCCDGYGLCCKTVEHPKACCLCWAGDFEIIYPTTCCKIYEQCFCCECFMALPSVEEGYRTTPVAFVNMPAGNDGKSKMNDVVIYGAACCSLESCNCNWPQCLGCYRKGVCLCYEFEMIQCKPMCCDEFRERQESLCICNKGNCALVMPYTCCKQISQTCCCDSRCACPCDDDVPCAYSMLPFCVCCVEGKCHCACCMTITDILRMRGDAQGLNRNNSQSSNGNGAPQVVTAQPIR